MRTHGRCISISHFRCTPLVAALASVLTPLAAGAAGPNIVTVNDPSDASFFNYGGPSPITTLRGALEYFNVPLNCTGNDVINFASGPFVTTVSSALPQIQCGNLTIDGTGVLPRIVGPNTNVSTGIAAASNTSTPATVNGIDISGFSYGGAGSALSGRLNATNNVVHGNYTGISVNGGVTVSGNRVFNNNVGVEVSYGGSANVVNNDVYSNSSGIRLNSNSGTVSGNIVGFDDRTRPELDAIPGNFSYGNSTAGIYANSSTVDISGNTVSGNGTNIYLQSDGGSQIHDNFIGTNSAGTAVTGGNGNGIYMQGTSFSYGTTITNNVISGNSNAIHLENASKVSIQGNAIGTDISERSFLAGSDGIVAYCGSGIVVSDNTIVTNFGTGVRFHAITSGGTASEISGNRIGLAGDGVTALGNNSYGVILGLTFCSSSGSTVVSDSIKVAANIVGNQSSYAINLNGADKTDVIGNTIKNGTVGIRVLRPSVSFVGNTISGNTITASVTGIQLNSDLTTINGNTITGNSGPGIYMNSANQTDISGNTITGNGGWGIDLESGANNQMRGNTLYGNAGSLLPADQKNINLAYPGGSRPVNSGGPNSGQNYPLIDVNGVTLDTAAGTTKIAFTFDAAPGTYQVDIFGNNPATTVPGGQLLDTRTLTVAATGAIPGSFTIAGVTADYISLLATHVQSKETSEFSPVQSAVRTPGVSVTPISINFGSVTVNSDSAPQTVTITSTGTADYQLVSLGDDTCSGGAICSSGPFTCTGCAPGVYKPGEFCRITATFHPITTGPFSKTIAFCDNVTPYSAGIPSRTVTFNGNAIAPPQVDITPASFDFGSVVVGSSSAAASFVVRNSGDASASLGTPSASPGFVLGATDCASTLAAATSCTASVTFQPTGVGAVSGALTFPWNTSVPSLAKSATATLAGTGAPVPFVQVDVSPTSFNFGSVTQGSVSAPNAFTIRNSGNAPASLSGLAASTGFVLNSTDCGATLAAAATCTASVSFLPPGLGAFSGTLSVSWSLGSTLFSAKSARKVAATASAALSGTGVSPPPVPVARVDIAPASFDFGSVIQGTVSAANSFLIRNSGDAAASLGSLGATANFLLNSTNCGATLAAATTCTASVSFAPTSVGPASGTLSLSWNSSTASAALSGAGLAVPVTQVSISPASFDFGQVLLGSSGPAQTFTVRNTGNAAANIGSVTATPSFVVNATNCGGTLAASASCLASVSFVPTRGGSITGVLTVGGASGLALGTAALSGFAAQEATLELPSTIDFGAYTSGTPALRRTVTLTASGNAVTSFSRISVTGAFTLINGCGPSLQPGTSCTLTLDFAAQAVGDYQGTLVVLSNAVGGSRSIPLTAHTVAAPTAQIRVTPVSIGFGDRLFASTSPAQRVTIANVGNAPAALSTPASTAVDFLVTTTCGATLAPGTTCFADVSMRPVGFGPRTGQLLVGSSAEGSPGVVNLSGAGCRPYVGNSNRGGGRSACAP